MANLADLEDEADQEETHGASSMRPAPFLPNTQARGAEHDPEAEERLQEQGTERAGLQPGAVHLPFELYFISKRCVLH